MSDDGKTCPLAFPDGGGEPTSDPPPDAEPEEREEPIEQEPTLPRPLLIDY